MPPTSSPRTRHLAALLAVVLLLVAVAADLPRRLRWWWTRARPPAPTVVFVVLDTVRADHTSLCGYPRPTTPFLSSLRDRGAVVACDAVAPGSWTLPSHASYFTGLEVPDHGAHFAATSDQEIRGMHLTPLPPDLPTLAEDFAARGYTTVGVSANPVLTEASGLSRGFDHWTAAPAFGALYGPGLHAALDAALDGIAPDRPLFLFLNVSDAHDPWTPIPDGLPWVGARDEGLHYFATEAPGAWEAYVTGSRSDAEAEALRTRVTDLYDYGLYRADDTLRVALNLLEARGWTDRGLRLVIVSDHGEFLGEHGLLRHGRYLWEENQRVPLLFLTTGEAAGPPVSLPDTPSALVAHDLVANGRPTIPRPARAAAYPDALWLERSGGRIGGSTSAAWWFGDDKVTWTDGATFRVDLAADPDEARPVPAPSPPDGFDAWAAAVRKSRVRAGRNDPALIEALQAAGYVAP